MSRKIVSVVEEGGLESTECIEEDVVMEPKKEGEKLTIMDIPGVGAATAEKLAAAGYDNLISVAVASPGELVELAGVTEATARKMIQFVRDKLDMGFESGDELLKRRARVEKITTGSKALNDLLGGGVETMVITECFGEFGSGKTQLAHTLCVNIQKNDPDAVAVFIDTENTFRPERIQQIAEATGVDPVSALKHVKVARAYNSDHQMLLAEKVEDLIKKEDLKVKLVVVDSLTAHFRAEFIGRGTLADRQQKINRHMHVLTKMAETYNLIVYVTNQVMAKPDTFFGDPTQAIGGHIVAHNSMFRLYLRKGKKGSRVAKLIDSPNLPEGEASFFVDQGGVRDI
jgi:DNA repair protein RadA